MAKSLNRTRIRDSWIVFAVTVLLAIFSPTLFEPGSWQYAAFQIVGYLLVSVCALGRLYCTAFLGGHKNTTLIASGPFSVVRNPLYVFSLLGVLGICLMTVRLPVILFTPLAVLGIYYFLVRREESFLLATFDAEYAQYLQKTPRFIPDFRHYHAPESTTLSPERLKSAFFDALWWFVPYPLLKLLELLT